MTASRSVRPSTAIADPSAPSNVLKPNADGSINVNTATGVTTDVNLTEIDGEAVATVSDGVQLVALADDAGAEITAANPLPVADAAVLAAIQALTGSLGALVVQPLGGALSAGATGTIYSNEGAVAISPFTLPAAAAGLRYGFAVQDADGIRVTAGAGDTIQVASAVSAAAGNAAATATGSYLYLIALNATEWMALSVVGTWMVT